MDPAKKQKLQDKIKKLQAKKAAIDTKIASVQAMIDADNKAATTTPAGAKK
jgi:hypothetical protein